MDVRALEQEIAIRQNRKLLSLLASVLLQKRKVLLCGLAVGLGAGIVSLLLKPNFTATVEILPPSLSRASSATSMLSQLAMGSDLGSIGSLSSAIQAKSQADTFLVLASARPIQDALVERFDLTKSYHKKNLVDARNALAEHTNLKATKEGFVIISVTDHDRNRAASVANGYVDQTRIFMRGLALTEASQRRVFYEGQLGKTKEDLAHAETAFRQMQQSSHMISLDSQARTLIEEAAALRSEVTASEVEVERLRSYLTDSNPKLQLAESELSALRGQLAQMEAKSENTYTGGALSSVPDAELAFVRATRELKYQEGLYDLMVKEYEGSRIDEARDAPLIQVIEPAVPPEKKSGPPRLLITLAGFASGVLLACIGILLQGWHSDHDFRGSQESEQFRRALFSW